MLDVGNICRTWIGKGWTCQGEDKVWEVGGNQKTTRILIGTQDEHTDELHTDDNPRMNLLDPTGNPGGVKHQCSTMLLNFNIYI